MDVYEEDEMLMISFVTSTSSLTTGAKSEEKGVGKKNAHFAKKERSLYKFSERDANLR